MIATKKVRDMSPEELKAYRHDCYMANRAAARARIMRWRERHPERHKVAVHKSYLAAVADGSYAAACRRWRAAIPNIPKWLERATLSVVVCGEKTILKRFVSGA